MLQSYTDLVIKVKEARTMTSLLPTEVITLLRPLQKAVKETGFLIQTSPWAFLAAPQPSNGTVNQATVNMQSPVSQVSQVPLPVTPQSAALGPAVQATVPSTPYSAMFSGNVFERADALLSMTTNSNTTSRTGTMTSSSMSADGSMSLSPMVPMSSVNSSRFNGNGKVTF